MGKRFTETDKWNDQWFRKLSTTLKLGYQYLLDCCDNAGVIDLDRELADFQIGEAVNWDELLQISDGRLVELPTHKILVTKFISFQYGALSDSSPPHKAVWKLLEKHNLNLEVIEGYRRGISTPQEKEKTKDKEKDKTKGDCKGGIFVRPTLDEVAAYCKERGNKINPARFHAYYEANGWVQSRSKPLKCWKSAVHTWEENNFKDKSFTDSADPRGNLTAATEYLNGAH